MSYVAPSPRKDDHLDVLLSWKIPLGNQNVDGVANALGARGGEPHRRVEPRAAEWGEGEDGEEREAAGGVGVERLSRRSPSSREAERLETAAPAARRRPRKDELLPREVLDLPVRRPLEGTSYCSDKEGRGLKLEPESPAYALCLFLARPSRRTHLGARYPSLLLLAGTRSLDKGEKSGSVLSVAVSMSAFFKEHECRDRPPADGQDKGLPASISGVFGQRSRGLLHFDRLHRSITSLPMRTLCRSLTPTARMRTTASGSLSTS